MTNHTYPNSTLDGRCRMTSDQILLKLGEVMPEREWSYNETDNIYACWNPDGSLTQMSESESIAWIEAA